MIIIVADNVHVDMQNINELIERMLVALCNNSCVLCNQLQQLSN